MDQEIITGSSSEISGGLAIQENDIQSFPEPVRKDIGHALYRVQIGATPPSAKPMRGIESGGVQGL